MSKIILLEEASTPTTPSAGKWAIYTKAGGLYYLDDAGIEIGPLSSGSGQTKASAAEVATGTDDAKFVTALAIKNSVNVPNVAPSTAGNVLTSDGSVWTSAAVMNNNYLINGGFNFFQRITPATATAMSDDAYNAPDRWYSLIQGANATINRNAGIGTSQYACKLVAGGTTNRYGIAQIIESNNSIPLRGQTVTAQCLIKPVNNSGSGTRDYRIAILEWTGTPDTVTSELVADWTSGTFTTAGFFASTTKTLVGCAAVTATHNTETTLSVTGTVSTSCNNIAVFIFSEDVPIHGSDYVLIGEAGLYVSGVLQKWQPRAVQVELALCQRYYEKSYDLDIAPGTNAAGILQVTANSEDTSLVSAPVLFKVQKFALPTITYYRYAGNVGTWNYRRSGVATTTATPSSSQISMYGFIVNLNVGSAWTASVIYGAITAECEL